MSTLVSERTRLPLGFVITIVTGAIGLTAAAAVANYRVGETAARVEQHGQAIQSHEVANSRTTTILEGLSKTVERIDRNVERMGRKREQ